MVQEGDPCATAFGQQQHSLAPLFVDREKRRENLLRHSLWRRNGQKGKIGKAVARSRLGLR